MSLRPSSLRRALSALLLAGCAPWAAAQVVTSRHEAAVDYSYVRGDAAGGDGLNLYGGDVSLAFAVGGPFALVAEVGANRAGSVSGTGLDVTIFTFMAGPRFSLSPGRKLQPSLQFLLGAARASGSAFSSIGSKTGFSMAPGLRLDYVLSSGFSLRLFEADYRYSTYQQDENNREKSVRLGSGIVIHF
jgi:outer membrane immunogenic protein